MKVAIIGPGAMGCLFGYFLSQSENEIFLLDHRQERANLIRREGIRVETRQGTRQAKVQVTVNPLEIENPDLIIICVKAYATGTAAQQAHAMIGKETLVLSLQNGLGNVETMVEYLGGERVLGGTTSQGANVIGPGHIRHAGGGETVIGEPGLGTERAERIADLFRKSGIETRVTDDLEGLIWSKVIINVGINALTALLRVQNGKLLEYEGASAVLENAVLEAAGVCARMGVNLLYPDAIERVKDVARATGENISSMLQDVRARRRTEINEINGAVVHAAKKTGLSAPVNEVLWRLVKALEQSYENQIPDQERG
jgi:2-dehydropantoate 2-reductase